MPIFGNQLKFTASNCGDAFLKSATLTAKLRYSVPNLRHQLFAMTNLNIFLPFSEEPVLHFKASEDSVFAEFLSLLPSHVEPRPDQNWLFVLNGSVHEHDHKICFAGANFSPYLFIVPPSSSFLSSSKGPFSFANIVSGVHHPGSPDSTSIMPELSSVLKQFVKLLTDPLGSLWHVPQQTVEIFERVVETVVGVQSEDEITDLPNITFLEDYNCALIARKVEAIGKTRLLLAYSDVIDVGDENMTTYVGSIDSSSYRNFIRRLKGTFLLCNEMENEEEYIDAVKEKGNGKQTTKNVSTVFAEITRLLSISEYHSKRSAPKIVDRGNRSGPEKRTGIWSVLLSVLNNVMTELGVWYMFRPFVVQLYLHITESCIECIDTQSSRVSFNAHCNSVMHILKEVALRAPDLKQVAEQFDMKLIEARCIRVRHELEQLVSKRMEAAATKYILDLPSMESVTFCKMKLRLDHSKDLDDEDEDLDGEEKDKKTSLSSAMRTDLSFILAPLKTIETFEDLCSWGKEAEKYAWETFGAWALTCDVVEKFIFNKMETPYQMDVNSIIHMDKMVDTYRGVVARILQDPCCNSMVLKVEVESMEVLVVWCAYCLAHSAASNDEQILIDYGIPLNEKNLQHLVLSKRHAISAAKNVVEYIRQHRKYDKYFFSTLPSDATISLASAVASKTESMKDLWNAEKENAQERESERWAQVQKKNLLLRGMDAKVIELEKEVFQCQMELNNIGYQRRMPKHQKALQKTAKDKLAEKEAELRQMKYDVNYVQKCPGPVIQPLPQRESNALAVIFFSEDPVLF